MSEEEYKVEVMLTMLGYFIEEVIKQENGG